MSYVWLRVTKCRGSHIQYMSEDPGWVWVLWDFSHVMFYFSFVFFCIPSRRYYQDQGIRGPMLCLPGSYVCHTWKGTRPLSILVNQRTFLLPYLGNRLLYQCKQRHNYNNKPHSFGCITATTEVIRRYFENENPSKHCKLCLGITLITRINQVRTSSSLKTERYWLSLNKNYLIWFMDHRWLYNVAMMSWSNFFISILVQATFCKLNWVILILNFFLVQSFKSSWNCLVGKMDV